MTRSPNSGVTLIELLIVVGLISLLVGISYPSVAAGLDAVRLRSATDSIAGFLTGALNRAEGRQQVIEVTIDKSENALLLRSAEPGFERKLAMPEGVHIEKILPELAGDPDAPRRFLLYPGGVVPRFGLEIANRRGSRRTVLVDPLTGAPRVERPETP
jgi:prepilin-type N-terminal cleavage/methylation domain-containing protein